MTKMKKTYLKPRQQTISLQAQLPLAATGEEKMSINREEETSVQFSRGAGTWEDE